MYARVSSSAFNVTFINFASKSLAFTPKFTAREREKKQIKVDARAFAVREEESKKELLIAH
jgi:hypothetical protein